MGGEREKGESDALEFKIISDDTRNYLIKCNYFTIEIH